MKGMFAFAIWDKQEKELFLARDRMGVKPLYYYKDSDKFIFASEIRGILATGLVNRKLDPAALVEYFSYQSVSYPLSAVEGVGQLEAGSWMKIQDGVRYGKACIGMLPDWKSILIFRIGRGCIKRSGNWMSQSVDKRIKLSDVPVGAFLSGGIDSSAVVGLMAETGSRPNTFNIAFEEKEFDESSHARSGRQEIQYRAYQNSIKAHGPAR